MTEFIRCYATEVPVRNFLACECDEIDVVSRLM